MYRIILLVFVLLIFIFHNACTCSSDIGSPTNPLIIEVLTPLKLSDAIRHIETISKFIERECGIKTAIYAPQKSIDYIKALSNTNRKADVAILNDIGYLFANDEFGAKAELLVLRGGNTEREITSYCPAIVSVTLHSLEALNGKGIAFSDEYSTAGYLIPSYVIKKMSIKPSNKVFAGSYSEALRLLLNNKVEAAAIYTSCDNMNNDLDSRSLLLTEFPDIFTKTTIIYKAPPIPNEPVVFRKNLPEKIKEKVVSALMKCPQDRDCRDALMSINKVTGFKRISGNEYNGIREIIRVLEKETADLIPGGWILKIRNNPELPKSGN